MSNKIRSFFWKNTHRNNLNLYSKILALFCLVNILSLFPDLLKIFSADGLISEQTTSGYLYPYSPKTSWITLPFELFGMSIESITSVILLIYVISLCFVFFNYKTIYAAIIAWILHVMLINSSYFFSYGADYFISFGLFMLVLFVSANQLKNIDDRKLISIFVIRFLQIHLCLVYFFAGFGKLLGKDWFDGNAVWYVLNSYSDNLNEEWAFLLSLSVYFFKIICWTTLILEFCYPLLITYRKTRKLSLVLVIAMHIGIMFFMKLHTFGLIMILLNMIAFGHVFHKEYRFIRNLYNYCKTWLKIKIHREYLA